MTDPTKNLADAARELLKAQEMLTDYYSLSCKLMDQKYGRVVDLTHLCSVVSVARGGMERALAAYDAAQEKRQETERIVEAGSLPSHLERAEEWEKCPENGCDLMRRARPDAGLLRAAKAAMRLGMCADALDILRAEVARVEGK